MVVERVARVEPGAAAAAQTRKPAHVDRVVQRQLRKPDPAGEEAPLRSMAPPP